MHILIRKRSQESVAPITEKNLDFEVAVVEAPLPLTSSGWKTISLISATHRRIACESPALKTNNHHMFLLSIISKAVE